jgi:hypothetical protein
VAAGRSDVSVSEPMRARRDPAWGMGTFGTPLAGHDAE